MPGKEWASLFSERKQAKKAAPSSSMAFYRLPAEGVAQIKGGSSHLKRSGLEVGLPRAGGMAKQLRALSALQEDMGSIPYTRIHTWQLTTVCNSKI